jgi:hypothetical protein
VLVDSRVGRFFYTKLPLNFQMAIKYTKWPEYIPNVHRIYQAFLFKGPPKFTQIRIFGLKIYHLATLVDSGRSKIPF